MAQTQRPIPDILLAEIGRLFPDQHPAIIMQGLDSYGTESYERVRERVQLAILKLSEGDVDQLLYYIGRAKQDYRDVLYWAEYSPLADTTTKGSGKAES